ncbi:MAG: polyprenol monophosphomannose synthase, partial [Halobacteriaceae archaeon]
MALSVIVPTYNERENIGPLLERIDATLDSEYEVVVVDDDSPDGTWEVAREHADEYPVRVVRRREESGLATAVVRGIEEATYDVLVVMDADLQHPPETIPDLLAALEDGADIAVGSRLVEGGGMPDFGPHRRLISYGANLVARILLREVRGVRDLQSGFFAFRRSVVWGADLAPRG